MHGGADTHRASAAALIPMAFVAAVVLALALLIAGGRTGTIVVQRITISSTTSRRGKPIHATALFVTAITETSASGAAQRSFTSNSFTRPGFQQVYAGNTLQLYDPNDNTVYVTTEQAQQRALVEQIRRTAPKGTTVHVGVAKLQAISPSSVAYTPGRTSTYQQLLRVGQYRLVGRATIDGRAALRLVESSSTRLPRSNAASFESTTTALVVPGSYAPIETINTSRFPGLRVTSVDRWRTYRVLSATRANQRLLSLTARHPHARVVHNALAFLRASQSETRTTTATTAFSVHSG